MRNSKHRTEYEQSSDEEHELLSKNNHHHHHHHHHRRKHKKHKYRGEELDYSKSKNSGDEMSVNNEVIEIQDSSGSENGSQNSRKCYDDYDKKLESHKSKHCRREERRHGKRRKKSRSRSRSKDKELEWSKSRSKKSKNDECKSKRYASSSYGEDESGNESRKKKSGESNSNDDKEFERGSSGEMKYKSEINKRSRSRFEHLGRDSCNDEEDDDKKPNGSKSRWKDVDQKPCGSRSNWTQKLDHKEKEWGVPGNKIPKKEPGEAEKPNFGLSGKLVEDTNVYNGVVIKYSEPPEARMPKRRWRLYPFKGDVPLPPLYIHRQSAYLLGRDRKVVDMPIDHPSCSKQHAALQYRLVSFERRDGSTGKQVRLYIIDLESANGTFINNKKIEARKYVELFEKDVIKFGFSSREYVLLHEHSVDDNPDGT